MKIFGTCVSCRTEADIITKDGRCGPCRYKDSLLTKKHVFAVVESVVIVQQISMSYEEVMAAIKAEYEKPNFNQQRVDELFSIKRAIYSREHQSQSDYSVTDAFRKRV